MACKKLVGTVVSEKLLNTRIVAVKKRIMDKRYGKVITRTKRYAVHDQEFNTGIGDIVHICEHPPISKTKNWLISNVIEKSSI
jgi:small subunit ribosomal protein S17